MEHAPSPRPSHANASALSWRVRTQTVGPPADRTRLKSQLHRALIVGLGRLNLSDLAVINSLISSPDS